MSAAKSKTPASSSTPNRLAAQNGDSKQRILTVDVSVALNMTANNSDILLEIIGKHSINFSFEMSITNTE